ncbi:hypothetical protein Hamer_G004509 [Homarus americanus]|uniref:Uncharacterized protein n=1 Tax=Homarus americanus TaxID=6706 RepID=A0A8J5MU42_HOMAM|nr:hypothetical protein Hamer_G004509 [Homarus americanus]
MQLRRIRRSDAGLHVLRPTGLVRYRACRLQTVDKSKVWSLYGTRQPDDCAAENRGLSDARTASRRVCFPVYRQYQVSIVDIKNLSSTLRIYRLHKASIVYIEDLSSTTLHQGSIVYIKNISSTSRIYRLHQGSSVYIKDLSSTSRIYRLHQGSIVYIKDLSSTTLHQGSIVYIKNLSSTSRIYRLHQGSTVYNLHKATIAYFKRGEACVIVRCEIRLALIDLSTKPRPLLASLETVTARS